MDLILLSNELYQLVTVTKEMMEGIELLSDVDCFDLCDILRVHLTTYHDAPYNVHVMKMALVSFTGVFVNKIESSRASKSCQWHFPVR